MVSCSKEENLSKKSIQDKEAAVEMITASAFLDKATINIQTKANANSWGNSNPNLVKDIAGANASYCHPDVRYFPNGLQGYKFWMVFTPYFGIIGSSGNASLYENPTVVVSNNAINWFNPLGLINPLQAPPLQADGELMAGGDRRGGYWSDTDWIYNNGQFELYYRGNFISQKSLQKIAANSPNNTRKLNAPSADRNIVRQVSSNGINWSALEIAYTSNAPATLYNNHVISPSFIKVADAIIAYEVLFNTQNEGYEGADKTFVLQRKSANGLDFTDFAASKIVHFDTKPWLSVNKNYTPWHLHACYSEGYYILTLAVGNAQNYSSEQIYLAFSKDGVNFRVYPKAIVSSDAYRSCIFPMGHTAEKIDFGAIIGLKSGYFKYRQFAVDKLLLSKFMN